MPKKRNDIDFEKALKELEELVVKMEKGNLNLEESLKYFERGVALTRTCQKALSEPEQKIQILLKKDGKQQLQDFDAGDNNK